MLRKKEVLEEYKCKEHCNPDLDDEISYGDKTGLSKETTERAVAEGINYVIYPSSPDTIKSFFHDHDAMTSEEIEDALKASLNPENWKLLTVRKLQGEFYLWERKFDVIPFGGRLQVSTMSGKDGEFMEVRGWKLSSRKSLP